MTTTETITRDQAETFLRWTAAHNLTGMIGSANGTRGYTLPEALGSLVRCTGVIQVESLNGMSILKATDVSNGQHRWYVHTEAPKAPPRNPWS